MAKLAYLGAVDPEDQSRVYRLPGKPDLVLRKGVEEEVSAAQAKKLKADDAHNFGRLSEQPAEEPFAGYAELDADGAIAALDDPNRVASAAVARELLEYEQANKDRKSVTEAAKHQIEAFEAGSAGEAESSSDSDSSGS